MPKISELTAIQKKRFDGSVDQVFALTDKLSEANQVKGNMGIDSIDPIEKTTYVLGVRSRLQEAQRAFLETCQDLGINFSSDETAAYLRQAEKDRNASQRR